MPIIPLLTTTNPLPNVPAPVLDKQARPTVNNAGIIKGIGDLATASQQPLLLADKLTAPYAGLGALGKAISDGGGVLGGLAMKMQEAQSDKQVADYDGKMDMARADFESWKLDNPDPSTWQKEWGSRLDTLRGQFGEDTKLTPQARQQVDLRLTRYGRQSSANVMEGAAKETFNQAKSSFLATIDRATENQDQGKFDEAVSTAQQKGYLFAHEAEGLKIRFEKTGEEKKKKAEADSMDSAQNSVAAIAGAQGADAAQKAIDDGTIGSFAPADKERLKGYAKQIGDAHAADSIGNVINGIYSGKITSEARIDEIAKGDAQLTPSLVEKAKEDLRRYDLRAAMQDREQNGVKNAVTLRHAVEDYSRAEDKDGTQFFTLKAAIKRGVPEGMGNEISNLLDQKFSGTLGKLPAAPETEKLVTQTLANIFDPVKGVLPWRTPDVQRYPKDESTFHLFRANEDHKQGEPVLDSGGKAQPLYDKNGKVVKWQDDLKTKEQAEIQEAAIMTKMRTWMQGNPDQANDPKAVTKKLMESVPEGARGAMYQSTLQKTLTPQASATGGTSGATLTSYGYAGDSTPDSRSAAGIGAFTPKEEEVKIRAGKDSWFKLRTGDIAASPDVEKQFIAKGISAGDLVGYQLSNGETRQGRFMDRTAQDAQIAAGKVKGVTQPLRGRIDTYSPGGKDKATGARVVKWWKIEDTASNT